MGGRAPLALQCIHLTGGASGTIELADRCGDIPGEAMRYLSGAALRHDRPWHPPAPGDQAWLISIFMIPPSMLRWRR
jgi:hypothetical protein